MRDIGVGKKKLVKAIFHLNLEKCLTSLLKKEIEK